MSFSWDIEQELEANYAPAKSPKVPARSRRSMGGKGKAVRLPLSTLGTNTPDKAKLGKQDRRRMSLKFSMKPMKLKGCECRKHGTRCVHTCRTHRSFPRPPPCLGLACLLLERGGATIHAHAPPPTDSLPLLLP
jgi:hypothetical protein